MPGFLLSVLPFLKKFGPWIVIGLLFIGVYSAGSMIVRDWKKSIHDTAFQEGETKERNRQDAIARKIESVLGPKLDAIDNKTSEQLESQSRKETVYVDRIKTKIKADTRYSACAVDDGVLRDRNEIRRSLETTPDSSAGSDTGETP